VSKYLRVAYLAAAALPMVFLPIGDSAVILALFVALDLAAAALLFDHSAEREKPRAVFALGDDTSLPLLRRTVPELRSRRPAAIIEAQVAWRQAADFRRRHGVVARRSPGLSVVQSPW
jgi:hypothetical protein